MFWIAMKEISSKQTHGHHSLVNPLIPGDNKKVTHT